jgi:ankyrin repeat protein
LSSGAPVRARDANKQTLLHYAARGGSAECLDLVLREGGSMDINATDKWNRTVGLSLSLSLSLVLTLPYTPLQMLRCTYSCLLSCADSNKNANSPFDIKWQPLHWAVLNGHASCVSLLLHNGAPAAPPQVPERVHKRRTTLVVETPIGIATRLRDEGVPGSEEVLSLLLAAAGPSATEPSTKHTPGR